MNHLKFLSKLQHPIMIGHTIIIISIILLTLLTSFWYIFIIIYAFFDIYLLWQLKHNHIDETWKLCKSFYMFIFSATTATSIG